MKGKEGKATDKAIAALLKIEARIVKKMTPQADLKRQLALVRRAIMEVFYAVGLALVAIGVGLVCGPT